MRTYWLIPGFALLLLGAGCALSKSQTNKSADELAVVDSANKPEPETPQAAKIMAPETVSVETVSAEPAPRVVSLNAGEFYFDPAIITAKGGESLVINFGTVVGTHTFTIDELGISKSMTAGGSVSLVAPLTPGRYIYYCSVGPHRTLGMTGTLVVE